MNRQTNICVHSFAQSKILIGMNSSDSASYKNRGRKF